MPKTQLAETVVTVTRVEQLAQEALPTAALITRAEIEGAQTLDLPILPRQETDRKINQKGGSGTVASAFVRGSESRRTQAGIDEV